MSISVFYGSDNNYAPYLGVSMTSLFENNPTADEITVYLACIDVSDENIKKYKCLAAQYNRNIVLLNTEKAKRQIEQYQCGKWNGSTATWLRFFVLDQIPETVDLLLWLDCDTIILDDICDLFKLDLNDSPIGAVCDCLSYYERFRLGVQYDEPNYNAGVLLFNLNLWRKCSMLAEMMQHLQKNVHRYTINDQDLLNDFFRGKIYKLPARYNVQGFQRVCSIDQYFKIYPWKHEAYYSKEDINAALSKPVVIHFIRFLGDYPWTQGKNYHPYRQLYQRYRDQSLWRDYPGASARKELIFYIEKIIFRSLPRKLFVNLFTCVIDRKKLKEPLSERGVFPL